MVAIMVGPLGLILVLLLWIIPQSIVGVGLMGLVLLGTYIILLLVVNNGFILQWGIFPVVSSDQNCTITFPVACNNTNYSVAMCREHVNSEDNVSWKWFGIWSKTMTQWSGRTREYPTRVGCKDRFIMICF